MAQATEKQIEFINSLWQELGKRNDDELEQPFIMRVYAHSDFHHLTKEQASQWINILKFSRSLSEVLASVDEKDLYAYLGRIGKSVKMAVEIMEIEDAPADEKRQQEIMTQVDRQLVRATLERLKNATVEQTPEELEEWENFITEPDLGDVMTASEVDEVYGLGEGTARQACNRGQIRARKSGPTWLIRRADAREMWGYKTITEYVMNNVPYKTLEEAEAAAKVLHPGKKTRLYPANFKGHPGEPLERISHFSSLYIEGVFQEGSRSFTGSSWLLELDEVGNIIVKW